MKPSKSKIITTGAVLYARVSSEEQREKNTIATQVHAARQLCQREGLTLGEIYRDEGVSGTVPFDQRPAGKRLLADARAGKFSLVLLYRVDRLGRLDTVSHIARHHLESLGVGLRSLTEPFDTSTPSGRFMFSILVGASAMERDGIVQRVTDGLHRAAQEGKWTGGRAPFGYQVVNQRLVPDEQEAPLVREMFTLAVRRVSLVRIARRLHERGLLTRTGTRWRFATIGRLLHSRTYLGEHWWGPPGQRITRPCPPLVSETVWSHAQAAIRANLKASPRNSTTAYLLRSLVRCSRCGRTMTGVCIHTARSQHRYYRCVNRYTEAGAQERCPGTYVQAEALERLVWHALADWILRRTDVDRALRTALQEQQAQAAERATVLAHAQRQLATKDAERDRIIDGFRRGLIAEHDLTRQLTAIDHEQVGLRETVAALQEHPPIDVAALSAEIRRTLDGFRHDVQRGTLPVARQRHLIESFVDRIVVSLPKGVALSDRIREVLPYRTPLPTLPVGTKETLWQRQPHAPAPLPGITIYYQFPWPSQPAAVPSITSPSLERPSTPRPHISSSRSRN
jgi:site-specific DNA recombinase